MEKIFDAIVRLKEKGLTREQLETLLEIWMDEKLSPSEQAFVSAVKDQKPARTKEQTQAELHEAIKAASNEEILRKQLELLAEYPRMPYGNSQIPDCSREMVQIYRELVKAKIRAVLLPVSLLGVGFSILYGLGVPFVKFANRK